MEVLWLKPQAVSNMSPLQMIVSQCCFWKMQASRSSAVWDQDELQGDVSNSPTAPNSVERVADSPVTCPLHPGGVRQTSYKLHMQLNQFTLLVSCSVLSSIFSDKQQQNLSLSLSLSIYLIPPLSISIYLCHSLWYSFVLYVKNIRQCRFWNCMHRWEENFCLLTRQRWWFFLYIQLAVSSISSLQVIVIRCCKRIDVRFYLVFQLLQYICLNQCCVFSNEFLTFQSCHMALQLNLSLCCTNCSSLFPPYFRFQLST